MEYRHTVYGLRLKGDREVRYVGLTYRPISERLRQHFQAARRHESSGGFGRWLLDNGAKVEGFPIAINDHREIAKAAERLTIKLCEVMGQRLFNRQCMTEKSA